MILFFDYDFIYRNIPWLCRKPVNELVSVAETDDGFFPFDFLEESVKVSMTSPFALAVVVKFGSGNEKDVDTGDGNRSDMQWFRYTECTGAQTLDA